MKSSGGWVLLLLCFLLREGASQSAVCAYKYRKRITFDPTKVSGPSDLANFPALVNITSDNDLRVVASSGHVESASGFDIIFTSDDGVTKLDHQLEKYTSTTGELVAWVRIPTLSTSLNTYIYMYYGNTAIVADQSLNTTWNSAYKGVWHLTNNVLTDGTANGNNGVNNGSTNMAAAQIGGGRTFAGTGTNYLQLPLSGASGGSGSGTVAFWGRLTTLAASKYFFGESTTQTGAYANRVQIYTNDAAGSLYIGLGGTHNLMNNVQTLAANTWYHIALMWATTGAGVGNYSVFVSGVQKGTGTYSAFTAIHTFGDMGNDGNAGQRTEEMTGNMDEVHVTNTALSSDWIITEYNNQNSPATFYSVSAEPKVWNGGSSTNYNTAANWLNGSSPASGNDVIINNGTNQPSLQANEQVNSIFIRTGAVLSLGANNLSVLSDISNCGTITGGTGMVTLNSGAANFQEQNLSGSGTYNLNNLTVNNVFATTPIVVLNKDVNVAGALVLTSGIVYTSATNILALGTGATSTSGSSSSFVSGPLSKAGSTDFVFPIGNGTKWRRAKVSNLTASATFRGEYFSSVYSNTTSINLPIQTVSKVEYWQVDQIAGTANANLSLYWEDAGASGINNCSDLTIARWNGASWDERPATTVGGSSCSGAGTGVITTNAALTAFSPFTFAGKLGGSVNPLPIELTEFTADCKEDVVVLNWSTATEKNNAYFVLERSNDGKLWTEINRIPGALTSQQAHKYSCNDSIIADDIVYYRLSQVDVDGNRSVFKIITAECPIGNVIPLVYPNPSANEVFVELDLKQNYGTGTIRIFDNLGKICLEQSENLSKGKNVFKIRHNLSAGIYSLVLVHSSLLIKAQKLSIR
ncbi:MAG: DUF2341 domain-containing protein [bacterium]|nr:DUF2341 domain-containing protein [bacterium]